MKAYLKVILSAALLAVACLGALGVFLSTAQPLAQALPALSAPAAPDGVQIKAVGDIMLSRKVDRLISERGMDYPSADVASYLSDADFTFANLESPLSLNGKPLPGKGIWFRAPPGNVAVLTSCGIDAVTLANNHMMDYDEPALLDTCTTLDGVGIAHLGAGKDIAAAGAPLFTDINGMQVAWLAYSQMADLYFSHDYPRRLRASASEPGINPYDIDSICADVAGLRDSADVVIVTLHWGTEYQDYPEAYQTFDAHAMIDAGADIIIGHHPHCIQGMEQYKNGLIFYSLGNFIFDQDWSEQTSMGVALNLTLSPLSWQQVEIVPVYIKDCRPSLATGQKATDILNNFAAFSAGFGAAFQRTGDTMLLKPQK